MCVTVVFFLATGFTFAVTRLRYPPLVLPVRSTDMIIVVDVELLLPATDCLPRSRRTIRRGARTFVGEADDLPLPHRLGCLCCTGRCPGACLPHKRLVILFLCWQKLRCCLGLRISLEQSLHDTTGLWHIAVLGGGVPSQVLRCLLKKYLCCSVLHLGQTKKFGASHGVACRWGGGSRSSS